MTIVCGVADLDSNNRHSMHPYIRYACRVCSCLHSSRHWVIFCRLHDQSIHHLCTTFSAAVTSTDHSPVYTLSGDVDFNYSITPRRDSAWVASRRVESKKSRANSTSNWHQHLVTITSLHNGHTPYDICRLHLSLILCHYDTCPLLLYTHRWKLWLKWRSRTYLSYPKSSNLL